jgi:hypothetical protein
VQLRMAIRAQGVRVGESYCECSTRWNVLKLSFRRLGIAPMDAHDTGKNPCKHRRFIEAESLKVCSEESNNSFARL